MLVSPKQLREFGLLGMNKRNFGYIGRYNPRTLFPLVDDKLKTKLIAQEADVAVPKLLGTISQQHEIANLRKIIDGVSGFCIKPAKGSGGKGILVITARDGDDFVKPSGSTMSMDDVERHLSNILSGLFSLGGSPDVAVVEALINFDPVFDGYSHEGVPDIRLIVFRGYPVMGMLRLATHSSDGKANLHQGAVGVGLDIATGRAINAVQYNQKVKLHPDTQKPLALLEVPHWERLLHLATRCYEMTGLGYLGTDIVLDKIHGPLLLELNARPGLSIQIANNAGLLPRLQRIESQRQISPDIDERVAYAKQHFGVNR